MFVSFPPCRSFEDEAANVHVINPSMHCCEIYVQQERRKDRNKEREKERKKERKKKRTERKKEKKKKRKKESKKRKQLPAFENRR